MEITRVITKMAAGSNSSVWQDLLLLSRQNEFSDLPAGCLSLSFMTVLMGPQCVSNSSHEIANETIRSIMLCNCIFTPIVR